MILDRHDTYSKIMGLEHSACYPIEGPARARVPSHHHPRLHPLPEPWGIHRVKCPLFYSRAVWIIASKLDIGLFWMYSVRAELAKQVLFLRHSVLQIRCSGEKTGSMNKLGHT